MALLHEAFVYVLFYRMVFLLCELYSCRIIPTIKTEDLSKNHVKNLFCSKKTATRMLFPVCDRKHEWTVTRKEPL